MTNKHGSENICIHGFKTKDCKYGCFVRDCEEKMTNINQPQEQSWREKLRDIEIEMGLIDYSYWAGEGYTKLRGASFGQRGWVRVDSMLDVPKIYISSGAIVKRHIRDDARYSLELRDKIIDLLSHIRREAVEERDRKWISAIEKYENQEGGNKEVWEEYIGLIKSLSTIKEEI